MNTKIGYWFQLPYSLNISFSRLSNVAKNNFFADLQTLPKCIRLYGGLRIKFSLVTLKTPKSAKNLPIKIFRLYMVRMCIKIYHLNVPNVSYINIHHGLYSVPVM